MSDLRLPEASPVSPDAIEQAADEHDVETGDLVDHLDRLQEGIEALGDNQFYTLIHESVKWKQITETEYQFVVWPQAWAKVLEETGVDNREEKYESPVGYNVDEIIENAEQFTPDDDEFRSEMGEAMQAAHRNHLLGDNTDQFDEIVDAAYSPDTVVSMSDDENGEPYVVNEVTLEKQQVTLEDIDLEDDLVALCVAHGGFEN